MELTVLNCIGFLLMLMGIFVPRNMKDKENANLIGIVINSIMAGFYMGGLVIYLMTR